jgi:membrane protein DedA with SNARE-associated domain
LEEHHAIFQRSGPWLVVASRWLPLLPEVISCLAGITRMPLRVFTLGLLCGAVPVGFVYAAIGAAGQQHPRIALFLSIIMPPLLWLAVRPRVRRRMPE